MTLFNPQTRTDDTMASIHPHDKIEIASILWRLASGDNVTVENITKAQAKVLRSRVQQMNKNNRNTAYISLVLENDKLWFSAVNDTPR